VEKYFRTGQATDDTMAHAHCMLVDNQGYTHSAHVILLLFHYNNVYPAL
jgi:hypothetical protein